MTKFQNLNKATAKLMTCAGLLALMASLAPKAMAQDACVDGTGVNSVQCGDNAVASGAGSTALGDGAVADGTRGVAIGRLTDTGALGRGTALGYQAQAIGQNSISIGTDSDATGEASIAIGADGDDFGNLTGNGAQASGDYSIAIGADASAESYSTALGSSASAAGFNSTALGTSASAAGFNSTALGRNASAAGGSTIALGEFASAAGAGSIALGVSANAAGHNSTVVGAVASAAGSRTTALGYRASAAGDGSTAVGYGTDTGLNAVALGGDGADMNADGAQALGNNSIVIGVDATDASFADVVVVGTGASATEAGQIILGDASTFTILGNGNMGLGTAAPGGTLDVNSGATDTTLLLTNAAVQWEIKSDAGNGKMTFTNKTNGNIPFKFSPNAIGGLLRVGIVANDQVDVKGNLVTTGTLTTGGPTCGGGCDAVFDADYDLPSIEEHAKAMYAGKHLPQVGPTIPLAPMNISETMGDMLNELEKAHIYIAQLSAEKGALEAKVDDLAAKFSILEQRVNQ